MSKINNNSTNSNEQCVLTLTREQALVVENACEMLARLHLGQFHFITERLFKYNGNMNEYCSRRDMANDLLKLASFEIFGRGAYNSPKISEKSDECERAWLVYTTLRHARSWHDNPNGGVTVNFDEPLPFNGEPMPDCKIVTEDRG